MDALLLHALSEKQRFNSLRSAVPTGLLSPETAVLLQWYQAYFQAFPERDKVHLDELKSLINLRSGNAAPEAVALTLHLAEELRKQPPKASVDGLLEQLYSLDLSGRAASLIQKYQNNEEIDIAHELHSLSADTVRRIAGSSATQFVDDNIGDLLEALSRDDGLKFRFLSALNLAVAGLMPGDSVMFAARVDSGKTSMLCKILTDFAPQIKNFFEPDRPILFLNNESVGARIKPRLYQAALNKTIPELVELNRQGVLQGMYDEALGGTEILLKDIHGQGLAQVEKLIQQINPSLVCIDMPANLRMNVGNGSKTDALEQAWQFIRELAANHKAIAIGTAQISIEGANMLYPPMSALKDTKTGVQGALDLQINMGQIDNPQAATLRGISTPKNKKSVLGQPSNVQTEVFFLKDVCQFVDGSQSG